VSHRSPLLPPHTPRAMCRPAVAKAAAFCIGNLVRGSRENAAALVAGGGVERLVDVMNDVDDDQTSKKVRGCRCFSLMCMVGLIPQASQ
jgi:hypothetical protein